MVSGQGHGPRYLLRRRSPCSDRVPKSPKPDGDLPMIRGVPELSRKDIGHIGDGIGYLEEIGIIWYHGH